MELGTHWGVSFFAFCQAVKDHNLPSQLNAVDTWQGEEHAGVYGEEVIKKVKEIIFCWINIIHSNSFPVFS